MRTRFIFIAIVGVLFCSLTTLETPELVKLADDTSNDYSLLTHKEDVSISICYSAPVARIRSRRRPVFDRTPIQIRFASSSRPAHDFLHFLCIQRT